MVIDPKWNLTPSKKKKKKKETNQKKKKKDKIPADVNKKNCNEHIFIKIGRLKKCLMDWWAKNCAVLWK